MEGQGITPVLTDCQITALDEHTALRFLLIVFDIIMIVMLNQEEIWISDLHTHIYLYL